MELQYDNVPIAFFDLDDTLTSRDTNSLWLDWRAKKDIRALPELMIGFYNYHYYKKGKLTGSKMNLFYRARTVGLSADSYKKMSNVFFSAIGIHHIYSDAVKLINAHREKGIHTVIITGQDNFVAHPFYRYLNTDALISNRQIVKKNRFRGLETPNCYAEGKIHLAGEYASKMGVDLKQCSFYSDSISDLPLLMKVKHPVAVNPDPKLFRIASESGWVIHTFSELHSARSVI